MDLKHHIEDIEAQTQSRGELAGLVQGAADREQARANFEANEYTTLKADYDAQEAAIESITPGTV